MYKISAVQQTAEAPKDSDFKALPTLLEAREESTCMCRFCCGRWREFTMTLNGNDQNGQSYTYLKFERPFKCSFVCCFVKMVNPQELSVLNGAGATVGRVYQHWDCIQFYFFPQLTWWYAIEDAAGQIVYMLRVQYPTLCNACRNCCAPSCLHKTFEIDIFDGGRQEQLGMVRAIWPGWSFRCLT